MVSRSYSSISPKFQSIGCSFFGGKSQHQFSLFAPAKTSVRLSLGQGEACRYLNVDFVSAENNGNVLTNAFQIAVPVWDVFVGDTGCDVEHDNTALALDIVTVT